jgi:uncharacterized protein YjiS (DUF1127 family)
VASEKKLKQLSGHANIIAKQSGLMSTGAQAESVKSLHVECDQMRSRHPHTVEVAAPAFSLFAPDASGRGGASSNAVRTLPWSRRESDPQRGTTAIVDMVLGWLERARQRRALMALSDHMLHDIGLSRAQAYGEAAKLFWRV